MHLILLIIKMTTRLAKVICVLICDSHDCLFCSYEFKGASDVKSEKATKGKKENDNNKKETNGTTVRF